MASVEVFGPFEVLTRALRLKPADRQPPELGPKVRVENVRLQPPNDSSRPNNLIGKRGLTTRGHLQAHDINPSNMWQHPWQTNLTLEFELPDVVPLSVIELWNYNAEWRTAEGAGRTDVAVSTDGATWRSVLRGAEVAEADGVPDYDEPAILWLDGVKARHVRLENLTPRGTNGQIGLSKVVFHAATNNQAAPLQPEDGVALASIANPTFNWLAGPGAAEYRVYFGTAPATLELLGAASEPPLDAPRLKPNTAYYWRVDAVQPDGGVVTGRVARFDTMGMLAHWKLDGANGSVIEDATGHQLNGRVAGAAKWATGLGPAGGALDFDGKQNYIYLGNSPEFQFQDGLTVSVWLKVRQFDKTWQAIINKGDHSWRLQREGEQGTVRFVAAGPKSAQPSGAHWPFVISKRAINDGQWHHVLGLYDGTRAALFIDGQLENSIEATGPMVRDDQPLFIGENPEERRRHFNGWMSDVRLYGYGLTDEEVRELYEQGRSTMAQSRQ